MKFVVALCGGASLLAMAPAAFAQQATPADTTAPAPVDTVVVTGSRIVRNGYAAPTPVTVASAAQLQASTPTDIPDALNKLPVFDGSQTGTAGQGGTGGANISSVPGNYLNLRDFGINRTLVLMNGLRVPPTNFNGQVDADTIPEMLLQRVDVVTGGASAVYGSDAVTGVVNFIMDTHFNGLKAQVNSGISNAGDMPSTRYGIAAGGDVANLGHFEGSFEHFQEGGLLHDQRAYGRADTVYTGAGTAANPYTLTNNPTMIPAGPPGYESAFGGYVPILPGPPGTNPSFAGQQFLNNGQLASFTPGAATGSTSIAQGGNGAYYTGTPLYAPQDTNQFYGRFDREITGNVSGFVQLSDSWARVTQNNDLFSPTALTMYAGNPYLPASAQAALTPGKSFTDIVFPRDLELMSQQTQLNSNLDVTAGLNGNLYDQYKWDLSYTHGESIYRQSATNNINQVHLLAAVDAVTGPGGTPVCYVSTTAYASLYPGCQPINLFGEGNESAAAEAYVLQTTQWQAVNTLDDYVGSISGSPVSDWAGPVSVALNAEYRQQGLVESTNASPLTPVNVTGLRNVTAATAPAEIYGYATTAATRASNSVWEVSGETVVPLAKDLPLIKSFDISGAVRYTDYSTSGSVETWKVGLDYQPIGDVRIRATESRDIRAPTLFDMFQGQSLIIQGLNDPVSGKAEGVSINTLPNPNLVPEVALTTTAGIVYSPSWFPRFRTSVDYYNITMNNAITSLAGNNPTVLAECALAPNSPLCTTLVVRGNGPTNLPTAVYQESFNISKTWTNGVDVEASYNLPLSDVYQPLRGNANFRLLYSYQPTLDTQLFAGAPVTNAAGVVGLASSRLTAFITYAFGPFTVDWQTRYYAPEARGQIGAGQVFAQPPLGAYSLSDLNLNYRFKVDSHQFDAFFNVQNLFNTPPQIAPSLQLSAIPGLGSPISLGEDGIGRYFTVGLKFQY